MGTDGVGDAGGETDDVADLKKRKKLNVFNGSS